jgi:hypothetical protein
MPQKEEFATQKIADLIHQFAGLSKCLPQFVDAVLNRELPYDTDEGLKDVYKVLVRNMQTIQTELQGALNTPPTKEEEEILDEVFDAYEGCDSDVAPMDCTLFRGKEERYPHGSFLVKDNEGDRCFEVSVREVQPGELQTD